MIAIVKVLNNATCFISIDNSLFLKTNYHYIRMVRFKSKRNIGAKTASFEITIHHSHNKCSDYLLQMQDLQRELNVDCHYPVSVIHNSLPLK